MITMITACMIKENVHDDDDDDDDVILDVAISAGYANNGLYKLYIRKCKCELELGRYED